MKAFVPTDTDLALAVPAPVAQDRVRTDQIDDYRFHMSTCSLPMSVRATPPTCSARARSGSPGIEHQASDMRWPYAAPRSQQNRSPPRATSPRAVLRDLLPPPYNPPTWSSVGGGLSPRSSTQSLDSRRPSFATHGGGAVTPNSNFSAFGVSMPHGALAGGRSPSPSPCPGSPRNLGAASPRTALALSNDAVCWLRRCSTDQEQSDIATTKLESRRDQKTVHRRMQSPTYRNASKSATSLAKSTKPPRASARLS